ncbi:PTS glucitol/sorbitol transporter subunit IIA [Acidipropionibacterium timonense]|uniref:PTS glucitol/sorbitol transporter subunit IIA n=1 Tax=Acidipropionibacterium timonense TaxID=2161818 RepID=UPI0010316DDE|nr:PTS glucitol/sorbitol transporter subunit IIA [Acidipropionibacterium timonense]
MGQAHPQVKWRAGVVRLGDDVAQMTEHDILVLFGNPVPVALSTLAVVHSRGGNQARVPSPSVVPRDLLRVGDQEFRVDEVGELANGNLGDIGHVVIYVDSPGQPILPGAIKVSAAAGGGVGLRTPAVGELICFEAPDEASGSTGEGAGR